MTSLFTGSSKIPTTPAEATQQTGASYSVKRPASPLSAPRQDYGRHRGLRTACIIRIDPSCGYACFWGLFGVLAAFWGVFEVVLQVRKLRTLNGVVARVQSIRDNMQVIGLNVQVMSLIRNRILV